MTAPSRARQRRRPEDAEREIVDAAVSLLREGSFADLTVANVMARTGLGRSSFYVYFADVPALLRRLAARSRASSSRSATCGSPVPATRTPPAARRPGIVDVYVRHGPVLKALADAAATQPEVEEIFRWGVVQHFIDAVAARCEEQYAAGRFPHLLPRPVAHALVLMTERYLADTLGRSPADDPATVAAALNVIWSKVLYGRDALPSAPGT